MKSWFRSIRATSLERRRPLAGDEFIARPIGSLTHAITMEGPTENAWPWLVQMGAGRAGWYSYDFLDNGRHASAKRILPELQDIAVGTLFPALPSATEGFKVIAYDIGHWLVLGFPSQRGRWASTWAFVLEQQAPTRARLIVRSRAASEFNFFGIPPPLGPKVGRVVHFFMQRKQLLEIAHRVEHLEIAHRVEHAVRADADSPTVTAA